jgi:hypothetical protein
MSIPDALAAFAEPPTTTVIIIEIKTDVEDLRSGYGGSES